MSRICSIDGCDGAFVARGWCSKHWQRWKKYGDPLAPPPPRPARPMCSIDGCTKEARGRGWCIKHYNRWFRSGSPLLGARPPAAHRFWEKVDKNGSGGCWLWTGALSTAGYGIFSADYRIGQAHVPAHRFSYELEVGPIPPGLEVDHLCMVKRCVNPAHLEPVTKAENMRRWSESLTHCRFGHPYTDANTKRGPRGKQCRVCLNATKRRYRARKRALAVERESNV